MKRERHICGGCGKAFPTSFDFNEHARTCATKPTQKHYELAMRELAKESDGMATNAQIDWRAWEIAGRCEFLKEWYGKGENDTD